MGSPAVIGLLAFCAVCLACPSVVLAKRSTHAKKPRPVRAPVEAKVQPSPAPTANPVDAVKPTPLPEATLSHVPPGQLAPTGTLSVHVSHAPEAKLFYRAEGAPFYASARVDGDTVSPSISEGTVRLEYFFTANDGDRVLQQLRSPTEPFSVPVLWPPVPLSRKWWFWTAIAGAVVAVGAGVTVAIVLTRPEPQNGNARVTLQF